VESRKSGERPPVAQRRKASFALSQSTPAPLDLDNHLPFRIAVLSNLLRVDRDPHVRRLSDLGARELRILLNVGSYMPVRAADVAYQSRLDTHTVSRGVKALRQQGLVTILRDELDQRTSLLSLTDQGHELYSALAEMLDRRSRRLSKCLSPGELGQLENMLERLEDCAEEILADEILECAEEGIPLLADQRELLRWYRRGV
jgi:DNA-binding MarR family transcriptional regulator